MRRKRRWGAAHIGFEVGLAASTVQSILNQAGVGRLDRGDRATDTRVARRYQRVITDNGACYLSGLWHRACQATGTTAKKTRPYRPQTNGKVERFHRILLEEWAYIRPWYSEIQRARVYEGFIHFYNHHRAHGALRWQTPTSITRDNLPGIHN